MIDAKTAKEKAQMKNSLDPMLDAFYFFVERESDKGNFSGNFYYNGEHFYPGVLTFLRSLSYEIYWNSDCLWYEVNWE
jgi:hypothetical protein